MGRVIAVAAPLLLACSLWAQTLDRPIRRPSDPGVITTRQAITPAGVQTVFDGRVHGVTFGSSGAELWVLTTGQIARLDWRLNRLVEQTPLAGKPGLQAIEFDRVSGRALAIVQAPARPRGPRRLDESAAGTGYRADRHARIGDSTHRR